MTEEKTIITTAEGDRKLGEHLVMWVKAGRQRQVGEGKEAGWPRTLEQFMNDVDADWIPEDGSANAADIQVPRRIKAIQFTQSNMETLLVRLPPLPLVQASLDRINDDGQQGVAYSLPEFYAPAVNNPPTSKSAKLSLFHQRVGDYTIAHCM